MAALDRELTGRLERLALDEGVELLAVEVAGTARKPTVRLVLDREGGVSLGDCERVSRQASVLLDAYDPFPGRFTLEVSSPGIDRKLYRPDDFERFRGQPVKVKMKPSWSGQRLYEGVLEGLLDGQVRLRDRDGVLQALPEQEIFETRLAPSEPSRRETRRGKR